ncbi:MAG: MOSC domain-containing protein [Verrucomicrobia bacterium]|nr:MOSC domain-containing protein [Verrucomicrobiota bacterium]
MIRIHHLFISPGHNYFGHHGGPPGDHSVIAADAAECVAGSGIRGDRFFDFKADYKGQITFFSLEVFAALRRELNLPHAQPAATRRNVFVSGAELTELVGREFEIQGVRFAGVEECRPCYWMNHAFGDERVENWLTGRGGLRARVLTDGILRRDMRGEIIAHPSVLQPRHAQPV